MQVACIGEAMVELSLDGSGTNAAIGFAGDTLNTAIYLKRAAPEVEVSFATRLGRDAFSTRLAEAVARERVGTDRIEISEDRRVGLYAITTDDAGERSFSYWPRQMFQSQEGHDFSALVGVSVVYLSAITLAILPDAMRMALFAWVEGFRQNGGRVAFDSNFRPALWDSIDIARDRVAEMWRRTDIAIPSVDDEIEIFGDVSTQAVVARLKSYGITDGALKCGPAGPISLGEAVQQDYAQAKQVVDTTAAGDSFSGGYLAAKLTGASQADALRAGHELAAYVVGHKGAIAPNR